MSSIGIQTSLPEEPRPAPAAAVKPPRVWPAVVLVGLYWAFAVVSRSVELPTGTRFFATIGVCALLILLFTVWWATNRRLGWKERLLGLGVAVAGGIVMGALTQYTLGVIGSLIFSLPWVYTAWTAWMLVARKATAQLRMGGLVLVIAGVWGFFCLLRMDGLSGDQSKADIRWRWSPREEDFFLQERARRLAEGSGRASPDTPREALSLRPGDWPGFRGPDRDSAVHDVRIATDWKADPPKPLWRQRVGPAWSSFAVVGDRLFTQEQRGPVEAVVCLDAATGREVWSHEDTTRFWEAVAGAGPRATPTFADGRLFALGGTGILNCLDAATGERKWFRDIAADSGAKVPMWGFVSSPLVVNDLVVVIAGGAGPRNVLAYRTGSGKEAWSAAAGPNSYTSPQLATIGGKPQILIFTDRGLTAVDPASGAVLWEHSLPIEGVPRSIQPHAVGKSQVLISSEQDLGTALLDVTRDGDSWAAAQRWVSRDLKPSFNDYVLHDGFLYGFDPNVFCCVDVQTGQRRWKAGRYGHGQVLLLADQGLLLVVSEGGQGKDAEVILVAANPEKHQELGRFQAIKGKTWNHPVIAHGRLYVRNAEEMACYELKPLTGGK
jgi:outer membrane protein assembly factor BamB